MKRVFPIALILGIFMALGLVSCSEPPAGEYVVLAYVSPGSALVMIYDSSNIPVTSGVTVEINGEPCDFFLVGYSGSPAIDPGDDVILTISGDLTVNETLICPDAPVVVDPITTDYDNDNQLGVEWTYPGMTDPDEFTIAVDPTFTVSTSGYSGSESGSATTHTIPGSRLKVSTNAYVTVSAANYTLLDGFTLGSAFILSNSGDSDLFNIVD